MRKCVSGQDLEERISRVLDELQGSKWWQTKQEISADERIVFSLRKTRISGPWDRRLIESHCIRKEQKLRFGFRTLRDVVES